MQWMQIPFLRLFSYEPENYSDLFHKNPKRISESCLSLAIIMNTTFLNRFKSISLLTL